MNEVSLLQLRNAIGHFVKMDDADWALLLPYVEERQLSKEDLFAKEGKVAQDIGFVLNGNMRHYYTRDGKKRPLTFILKDIF